MVPEHQRHQEWQTGVAGEKQPAGIAPTNDIEKHSRIKRRLGRKLGNMGDTDENRSGDDEYSHAFKHEWNTVWLRKQSPSDITDQNQNAPSHNEIDVKHPNIIQDNIGHRIFTDPSGVVVGPIINCDTGAKKQNGPNSGHFERFLRPMNFMILDDGAHFKSNARDDW